MGGAVDKDGVHNIGTVIGNIAGNPAFGSPDAATAQAIAQDLAGAAAFAPNVVESAEDFRFYIRYRF